MHEVLRKRDIKGVLKLRLREAVSYRSHSLTARGSGIIRLLLPKTI
jgi:hypothetical protein